MWASGKSTETSPQTQTGQRRAGKGQGSWQNALTESATESLAGQLSSRDSLQPPSLGLSEQRGLERDHVGDRGRGSSRLTPEEDTAYPWEGPLSGTLSHGEGLEQ